jgi:hypothetical protein
MLALVCAVLLALATNVTQGAPPPESEPAHRVSIRVVGSVALVDVEREVPIGSAQAPARDTVLDLDLPEGAAFVDWAARSGGRTVKIVATTENTARAEYARTLSSHQLAPTQTPADDAVRIRVHLAPLAGPGHLILRYRYTVPVACADGRFVLRLPASLEDNPTPAAVTVSFADLPVDVRLQEASVAGQPIRIPSNGRVSMVHIRAPGRAGWEVSYTLREQAAAWPSQLLAARESRRDKGAAASVVALCRPQRRGSDSPPGEVMLLIDRSRSVGAGGMSSERALARALLEALPPSQRFNAMLFAKTATQIFPIPRVATREALGALTTAADPNQLENGSDFVAALRSAAVWARAASGGGFRLLVIISDGALPETETAAMLSDAVASVAPIAGLRVMVLLVRPAADDPVPVQAVERFAELVGHFGGVVRLLSSDDLQSAARSSLAALAQGGDLLNVRTEGRKGPALASGVAPGTGFTRAFNWPLRHASRFQVAAEYAGATVRASASAVSVATEWLRPLVDSQPPKVWAGSQSDVAVFVETVTPRPPAGDTVVRGQMDPLVLRNALALAFLPRARACYLSRRVANSADLALRGRIRLELHLERGELEDAIIRRSNLNRPEIERCVQQAAFEVEYPRPMFRDAPTVASVNLVFAPRTAEENHPDASSFDREIDLILGPVTFDPKELLEGESKHGGATDNAQSD